MNWSTGVLCCRPLIVCWKVGVATSVSCGCLRSRSMRSLPAPGAADQRAQVLDRRLRVAQQRAQLREERSQARRDRLGRVDELVEVVQRGAQVDERRVGLAQRPRQRGQRLVQRRALGRDRRRGRIGVAHQAGEVVATRRQRGRRARRVDDEVLQRLLVAVELVDQLRGRAERRVEVLQGLVGLGALALVLLRGALDDLLQRLARLGVERVEELVEVDRGGGPVEAERRAVIELGRRVRPRRRARCSGWPRPTASRSGSWPSCRRAAARRARQPGPGPRPGCCQRA